HPLVHAHRATREGSGFTTQFSGAEFFLADHQVMGRKLLPAVAYLEMARAAVRLAAGTGASMETGFTLTDVVWVRPFVAGKQPARLHIGLQTGTEEIAFRIFSSAPEGEGEDVLHAQG